MVQVQPAARSVVLPSWPRSAGLLARLRLPPEEGAVRLGNAWFRVRSFETRRPTDPATAPARTVGQVCLPLGEGPVSAVGPEEAVAVCRRQTGPSPSEESAREKVVFLEANGATFVYQADRTRGSATLCACGNAAGAATALLAESHRRLRWHQQLVLPDGTVAMQADVCPAPSGWLVEQSWTGIRFDAFAARWNELDVIVCTGTLNDYLIVALPDAERFAAFQLADALACWEQGRARFGFADPLRSRLVAVTCSGAIPQARFFTCGRAHPGAPLTGLALLALAAPRFDLLAPLARAGHVEHRRGVDALPGIFEGGRRVEMSPIHVLLRAG